MKNSIIIGIAGGSASGKTSISRQVYEFFKGSHTTCIIKQDDYYKDQSHLSFEESDVSIKTVQVKWKN